MKYPLTNLIFSIVLLLSECKYFQVSSSHYGDPAKAFCSVTMEELLQLSSSIQYPDPLNIHLFTRVMEEMLRKIILRCLSEQLVFPVSQSTLRKPSLRNTSNSMELTSHAQNNCLQWIKFFSETYFGKMGSCRLTHCNVLEQVGSASDLLPGHSSRVRSF